MPDKPLGLSDNLRGFGFFDQHGDLIVLTTHTGSHAAQAQVRLADLEDGSYVARDLINDERVAFVISGQAGSFSFSVERWGVRPWQIRKQK
ncbi:MAG: hypothetical protein HC898_08120 [Phycisphaerales bacterium]|nr:hypothetical protein [Phycisphaerales bacterium]